MVDKRQPSFPPSDPRQPAIGPLAPRSGRDEFIGGDRPARTALLGAAVFGLVLIASGVVLWRRQHGPVDGGPDESVAGASSASISDDAGPASPALEVRPPSPVTLSDARVLGCHDKGRGTTLPDECDHVTPVEQALARVITQASTCVPESGSGGTIEYVADVSFTRHKVRVALPRAGRSLQDRKVLHACAAAVRVGLQSTPLDGIEHKHARYSISVTATYRGAPPTQAVPGTAGGAAPRTTTAAMPSPGSVRN